jgi:small subunit ribosomal protein S1
MTEEKKEVVEETKPEVQEEPIPEKQDEPVSEQQPEEVKPEEAKEDENEVKAEPVEEVKTEEAADGKSEETEKKDSVNKKEKQEDEIEVVRLEDLTEESEYSDKEIDFLTQMYDKTLRQIKQGDIVKGKILDVTDSDVLVDIGFKSEGIIPGDEFDDLKAVQVGEELEVFLENVEDPNGQLILSRRRADFIRVWENVVEKFEKNETINGTIVRRIKGGMVVTLNGVDAFLPGSQIDVKPIRDFDSYLGREMEFRIVKVNHARRNIVVSSRVLIEKEMESQRSEIIKTIEKGQVRKGTVKNITDFGVFIDLGGVDGLLHITDLSWGRVNHPSEVVKLDEDIEVVILDFNENKDRISLGRKQLMPHPWENIEDKYPMAKVIIGKVVSLTDYGAFIELETGIEGLIHISEMSWSQHIKHPSQLLHVGMEIEAKVLNVESDEKKISLGLKQLEPDPWEKIDDKYPLNSKHTGVVRNLTQFGAFVELEEGIDGLVHISDLSWTKKIRHPSEVVKKGDEIEVVVLGINRDERRIALGHKQIEENPWDAFENKYKVDTETNGTVSRIIDKGVIVTLPLGVDGFIPINHLGHPKLKKATEYYKTGDEIPAKVIEFDKDNKKIVLSVSNYFKGKEEKEWESYLSKQGVEKNTMEEILKSSLATSDNKSDEKVELPPEMNEEAVKEKPEETVSEEKIVDEAVVKEEVVDEKVEKDEATAEEVVKEEAVAEGVTEEAINKTEVVEETPETEPMTESVPEVVTEVDEQTETPEEEVAEVEKKTKKKKTATKKEKTEVAEDAEKEEKPKKAKTTKKKTEPEVAVEDAEKEES